MYRENSDYQESQKAAYYEKKNDLDFLAKRNDYLNGRYKDNPDAYWAKNTKRKYKITPDEYEWLLAEQEYCCALCGISRDQLDRRLAIDHDHACCGKDRACKKCIRGLLCGMCNKGFVPMAEVHPILQSFLVREYLARRPFIKELN
jgi:recombination endonuclease VII